MKMLRLSKSGDPEVDARRVAAERHGMALVSSMYYDDSAVEEEWVEVANGAWHVGSAQLIRGYLVRNEAEALERRLNLQIEERNDGTVQ